MLALLANEYMYPRNITILLATESRVPTATEYAERIIREHGNKGMKIVNIVHPDGLPDE